MSFYSPLRYPGGKTRLFPFIESLFKENGLGGLDYFEPYAGGAGLALNLLYDGYVNEITINDIDRSIYSFWHSAVYETDELCRKIKKVNIDVETWREMKQIQKDKESADFLELGFSTLFLNRVNISGVINKAGIIGGLKQRGKYKMDVRFNKSKLLERIRKIGKFRNRILPTHGDALELLKDKLNKRKRNSLFIYLDPPYINKGRELYINFYRDEDHRSLADFVKSEISGKQHWVVSYDKSELSKNLYTCFSNRLNWSKNYGTSNSGGKEEYIFVDNHLKTEQSPQYLESGNPI